ncbi:MAG: hypothetical protein JXA28_12320 [Bacteroidetes bacterium]|nr:hypothetical protein [Bacteroidota bacterium]
MFSAFTENRGQVRDTDGQPRPDIRYYADMHGTRIYVTSRGISYVFTESEARDASNDDANSMDVLSEDTGTAVTLAYRVDMDLDGMNTGARIRTDEPAAWYANYYLGHCPEGILGVRSYATLVYENVYPAIDMVLRCAGKAGSSRSSSCAREGIPQPFACATGERNPARSSPAAVCSYNRRWVRSRKARR